MRDKYEVKPGSEGPVSKFLGVIFKRIPLADGSRHISLCMKDYANHIVENYEAAYHKTTHPRDVPTTLNLYEAKDNARAKEATFAPLKPADLKRLQTTIGELLWLCRTTRHDTSFAVVQLAARVLCWDDTCQLQLDILI